MTAAYSPSQALKIIIRDLQLLALTAELPKAPKVCVDLANLEETLRKEGSSSHPAH